MHFSDYADELLHNNFYHCHWNVLAFPFAFTNEIPQALIHFLHQNVNLLILFVFPISVRKQDRTEILQLNLYCIALIKQIDKLLS
jgi:hypothetical protein